METFIRKGKILLLFCLAFGLVAAVRPNSERALTHDENAARLLKSAERWMGVRELTGNNDHPMITVAMRLCGLDGDKGYAWCAASQAEIHFYAGIKAPRSARVVDWFITNIIWEKGKGEINNSEVGMVGGLYYQNLRRLGHIFLIVGEDKNNFYTLEGNTNSAGSREGDGFYRKIRSKSSVAALADYCKPEHN